MIDQSPIPPPEAEPEPHQRTASVLEQLDRVGLALVIAGTAVFFLSRAVDGVVGYGVAAVVGGILMWVAIARIRRRLGIEDPADSDASETDDQDQPAQAAERESFLDRVYNLVDRLWQ